MSGPQITYTSGRVELHGTVETREDADLLVDMAIGARLMLLADIAAREMNRSPPDDAQNAVRVAKQATGEE